MTRPVNISFVTPTDEKIAKFEGRVTLILTQLKALPGGLPRAVRNMVARALEEKGAKGMKTGESMEFAYPPGMAASALQIIHLPARSDEIEARKAGAKIGAKAGKSPVLILAGTHRRAPDVAFGLALKAYDFSIYKTTKEDDAEKESDSEAGSEAPASVTVVSKSAEEHAQSYARLAAVAEGVFFTRDLINEPGNVLTTTEFAKRLQEMSDIGLDVEVIEEAALEKLGMRALLAVGQGSESPSKVVVMRWNGGDEDAAPLALVGKGVVFDSGGISIKPSAGMEEMTMDMGGAGVVAGVMRSLALRKARTNVVGLVGLVENMPDGRAQRPGDIVRSMKGDTIEVINTDAEGRMVLADVLWYAQTKYEPRAVIDLATLTGAAIIALGHENAAVFSNDDKLADNILGSAKSESEGAWRLPLGPGYAKLIKSRLADIKNTGGRAAGSITAAEFLACFIREDQPWAHIDIAGVALPPSETDFAPKGASGWGVMTLNRLVQDHFET